MRLPADFCRRLAAIRPPLTAVVIGTRPLDLDAVCQAAGASPADLAGTAITQLDVSSPDLARYFEPAA